MIKVFPSSDKMLVKPSKHKFEVKYPWATIKIGESFVIDDKMIVKHRSLVVMASRAGRKLKRRFRIVEHDACYEIGRIA